MISKKVVARNVIWNWAGIACEMAAAFAVAPFLVHRLGETTYGIWILIGSLTGYFGLLDFGVRGSVGRFLAFHRAAGDRGAVNSTLSTAMALCSAVACLVLVAGAGAQFVFFRAFEVPPDQADAVRVALWLVFVNLAVTFPLSLFDGTLWAAHRFDVLNAIDIPSTLARAALSFVVVGAGYGLVGLATLTLIVTVLQGGAKAVASWYDDPGLRVRPAHVTRAAGGALFGYGLVNFVITVARMTRTQMSPLLIGSIMGAATVTLYSIAKRLVDYSEKGVVAATGVLTPVATALQARGDGESQRALLVQGGKLTAALSFFFVAFLALLGEPLITLWMGSRWSHASGLLLVLAIGEALPLSQSTTGNMLLGMARHRVLAVLTAAEVLAIVVIGGALAGRFGVIGLCAALAVSGTVCRGVLVMVFGCRAVGVTVGYYVQHALVPALWAAALPVAGLAAAVALAAPSGWAQFVAYTAAYGAVWALACVPLIRVGIFRSALVTLKRRYSLDKLS